VTKVGIRLHLWSKEFSSPDDGGLGKPSILPSWFDMACLPAYSILHGLGTKLCNFTKQPTLSRDLWPVSNVAYRRSTAGLLGIKPLVPQDNAAKGSRQNSCVTLEDSVAPKIEDRMDPGATDQRFGDSLTSVRLVASWATGRCFFSSSEVERSS